MHRTSGILLHLTSLPGRFGSGDVGPAARRFVDFLAAAGQGLWQVLLLGPTGYADSPYQALSALAGNPLLTAEALVLITPDVETLRKHCGTPGSGKRFNNRDSRAPARFEHALQPKTALKPYCDC